MPSESGGYTRTCAQHTRVLARLASGPCGRGRARQPQAGRRPTAAPLQGVHVHVAGGRRGRHAYLWNKNHAFILIAELDYINHLIKCNELISVVC